VVSLLGYRFRVRATDGRPPLSLSADQSPGRKPNASPKARDGIVFYVVDLAATADSAWACSLV